MMHVTRRISVSGRVQGVGFREALRVEAIRRDVRGWVRNRRDGSVEALLQGTPELVEAMVAWARRGPPAARVTGVEVLPPEAEFDRAYSGFERLPTA